MKRKCDAVKCANEAKYLIKLEARGLKIRPCKVCQGCLDEQRKTFGELLEVSELPSQTQIINRSFEQINCPNCKLIVLIPDVDFRADDDQPKQRHCVCVHCGTMILVRLKKEGEIKVYRQHPCYIYPETPNAGISTGVRFTTELYIQKNPFTEMFEARAGFAMMGNVNFPSSIEACPFDWNFHDNYVQGVGDSPNEAVADMIVQHQKNVQSLWS